MRMISERESHVNTKRKINQPELKQNQQRTWSELTRVRVRVRVRVSVMVSVMVSVRVSVRVRVRVGVENYVV